MASKHTPYGFPAEHKDFFDEFQSSRKKYPLAAARFALADMGPGAADPRSGPRPPEIHCFETEWGVVCPPIEPLV
jgi:hypothetical protein